MQNVPSFLICLRQLKPTKKIDKRKIKVPRRSTIHQIFAEQGVAPKLGDLQLEKRRDSFARAGREERYLIKNLIYFLIQGTCLDSALVG